MTSQPTVRHWNIEPAPDFNRLLKVLRREGEPDRPPLYEIFSDIEHEILRLLGCAVDPEPGLSPEQERDWWFRKHVEYSYLLGYDYVDVSVEGLDFKSRSTWSKGTTHEGERLYFTATARSIASREDFERHPWPDPADIDYDGIVFIHKRRRRSERPTKLALVIMGIVLSGLCAGAAWRHMRKPERPPFELAGVKAALTPLDLAGQPTHPAAVQAYFRYYALDIPDAVHRFGTFSSTGYVLAAHVFEPAEPRGTVFMLHGYYDHAGILANLARDLVEHGYIVAVYDHPGHGLSTGERANIGDFADYVAVFRDFIRLCRPHMTGPIHLIAHSLGGAIAADHLLTATEPVIERSVLIAPLVHSAAWNLSGLGLRVAPGLNRTPRAFRRNSSDGVFLKFLKKDPLQARHVPMTWVRALRAWNERAATYEPVADGTPLKIVQGKADTTVDWSYSIEFLRTKFPGADVTFIEKGGHQLPNEAPALRARLFELVREHLMPNTGPLGEP